MASRLTCWSQRTTTVHDGLILSMHEGRGKESGERIIQQDKDDKKEMIHLVERLNVTELLDISYGNLSRGERTTVELVAVLVSHMSQGGIVVVDEFTSFLDRSTASLLCFALSSWLRDWNERRKKKGRENPLRLVLIGCHLDVVKSLRPCWTYDTTQHMLVCFDPTTTGVLLVPAAAPLSMPIPIPSIDLRIVPCVPSLWRRFRAHHYKTKKLSQVATTYVALATLTTHDTASGRGVAGREVPVAMVSTIRHNGKANVVSGVTPSRAHRTVVLPEWQGLGIGSHVSDGAGEIRYVGMGSEYYGQTVHPAFGSYRDRSPLWVASQYNHTLQEYKIETWKQRKKFIRVRLDVPKFIYSHRYVGDVCQVREKVVLMEEEEAEEEEKAAGGEKDGAVEEEQQGKMASSTRNDQGGRRAKSLVSGGKLEVGVTAESKYRPSSIEMRRMYKKQRMTVVPLRQAE